MKLAQLTTTILITLLGATIGFASNANAQLQEFIKKQSDLNTLNEILVQPLYEQNLGNGKKLEIDSTGAGIRFDNGIRIGVERLPTGKPQIDRIGKTTIVDHNPKTTGIGIEYRF